MALPRIVTGTIGQAARTVGRTIDYATPGSGTNTLTRYGRNVGNITTDVYGSTLRGNDGAKVAPSPYAPGLSVNDVARMNADIAARNGARTTQAGAAAADPYARYGGQAAYNNIRQGFTDQQNVVNSSAATAARNSAAQRNLGILDFLDQLKQGQGAIETRAINNERTRMQGLQGVQQQVGQGVRNAGTLLSARNAGSASVGAEIARGIGDAGRRQAQGIENDYELQNADIGTAQEALNTQRASGLRKFDYDKMNAIDSIVGQAESSLAEINAAMANASLGDRIALDQEKNRIRAEATQLLSQYDNQLNEGVAGIRAGDQMGRRGEANRLMNLGEDYERSFNYDTEIPVEYQGTGPFASELPIFTYRRNRTA